MKTTFIYRHFNYDKTPEKARKSLYHSFRVKTEETKKNEWVNHLTDGNCFVYHNGKKLNIASLNEGQRRKFCEDVIKADFGEIIPKETKQKHRQYKAKLTKKIKTEHEKDNNFLAETLEKIKDNPLLNYTKMIDEIDGVKRKKQLVNMVKTYCDLAEKCSGKSNRNEAKLHEAFFKFPDIHGVTTKQASLDSMAECLRDFYKENFPDYPVRALVVHHDERDNLSDGGAHPHIFVSTKNAKTGVRDFRKTMIAKINEHLKLAPVEFKYEWAEGDEIKSKIEKIERLGDENGNINYHQTQIMGSIMQDMFLNHLRVRYPDLDIDFTEERKRSYGVKCNQYADNKNRKSDREYNLNNLIKKQHTTMKLELDELRGTAKMQVKALERMKEVNERMKRSHIKTKYDIAQLKSESERLKVKNTQIKIKREQLELEKKELENDIKTLKVVLGKWKSYLQSSVARAIEYINNRKPTEKQDSRLRDSVENVTRGAFVISKGAEETIIELANQIDANAGNGCNNTAIVKEALKS